MRVCLAFWVSKTPDREVEGRPTGALNISVHTGSECGREVCSEIVHSLLQSFIVQGAEPRQCYRGQSIELVILLIVEKVSPLTATHVFTS